MQTITEFMTQKQARRQLQEETDDCLLRCNSARFEELCQVEVMVKLFEPGNVVGVVSRNRCKKGTVLGYNKNKTGFWKLVVLMYPKGPVRSFRIDPGSYQGDIAACREPERERVYLYESFCGSKHTKVALIVDKRVI